MEENQSTFTSMFPAGKRELIFGALILVISLLLVNCFFFGGLNLGFAIAYSLCVVCSSLYLLCRGAKPTGYAISLLVLSVVIAASFARADDFVVKGMMVCFLFVSTNLGLCLLAGKNRHTAGGIRSLTDAFFTHFGLGFGKLPASVRGVRFAFRHSGSVGQKGGAILLGLGISLPVLLVIVPLLIQADAAFEGLLRHIPSISVGEIICTLLFGTCLSAILYTRNTALRNTPAKEAPIRFFRGISVLTVNTVLFTVCLVYCAYLVSQLAYFTGGFAGVLPEDYTLAEYARRGFFEMAWLCAINLSIIVLCLWLCRKETLAPLLTRLLCLFISIVTLFLVATASAKMILYIDSFGLTRLRLLTQVVMIFFGITTAFVSVWLFVPRFAYMKAVILTALVIGASVSWADVDTQVARYNVNRYLSGKAETVDVNYLNNLGNSAVPYIRQLSQEAPDAAIREDAQTFLDHWWVTAPEDFRSWNYVNRIAAEILGPPPEAAEDTDFR